MSEYNEKVLYHFNKNKDIFDERVEQGIEQNRKGIFHLQFVDERGEALKGAEVKIEQIGHDFNFGSNIFMLDEFDDEKKNEIYREDFKKIFNLAVAPFYWQDVETENGQYRFEVDSKRVPRRPSPGLVLDYCKQNDLRCKGHVLVWHCPGISVPSWVPQEMEERFAYIKRYMKAVAERFGADLCCCDVVNEMIFHRRAAHLNFPENYVEKSFKYADKLFDERTSLFINEGTDLSWKDFTGDTSYYYLMIENLLLKGCRIDGIGLQYHMKKMKPTLLEQSPIFLDPERLFRILDFYGRLQKKIHISEITIPMHEDIKEDEELQAALCERLYSLWFSHAAVDGIMWWNLVDGTAFGSENVFNAGLLKRDMSRKLAYDVLDELINHKWHTELTPTLDGEGKCDFKAFYGKYKVTVDYNGKKLERTLSLKKGEYNRFIIPTEGNITCPNDILYKFTMA